MWPYLLFGGASAFLASVGGRRRLKAGALLFLFFFLVFFIGLRHRVGPDWTSYLLMMGKAQHMGRFADFAHVAEPFYTLLLLLGDWSDCGIYFANVVVAVIFAYGLLSFVRMVPEPWMGFMAAVPSLITAVATSANRQTAAVGILLWVFANWERSGLIKRVGVIALAAGFHYSALVALVFVGSTFRINFWLKLVALAVFAGLIVFLMQSMDRIEYYNNAYGTGQTEGSKSAGALIHVSFNALPALLYFLLPRFRLILFPTALLRQMAFAAMAMLPLAVVASTAASRTSFYWYPVSIWVFGSLPLVFEPRSRPIVRTVIASVLALAMIGWLNFANMAGYHIPYRNALFENSWQLDIGNF